MSRFVHNLIKIEYEKKQKAAHDNLMTKKNELYSKIPRLQEIESEIQFSGIRYNRMILLGSTPAEDSVHLLTSKINELKEEKEMLLIKHGYPQDFLELKFECPSCRDTGFIQVNNISEKCSCYKQQYISHLYMLSNLKLTEMESFSMFDPGLYPATEDEGKYGIKVSPRNNILKIKERCLKFIENFNKPEEKNLFFSGLTGVGKTFMSCCIARELLNKSRTVLYQTAPSLFNIISQNKVSSFKGENYLDESYNSIFNVELLIIDDLGTEPPSAARYSELLSILDTRHSNNLVRPCKTIISTNIGTRHLHEYYDERVASRIIGSFDMFRFVGEDIRMLKKKSTK